MKTKLFLTTFLLIILQFSWGDNSDANPPADNSEILKLSETPISIKESSFKFDDGSTQNVPSIFLEEIDGSPFVISQKTSQGRFAVSLDENNIPNGAFVMFQPNENTELFGQNFSVTEGESSITFIGQVSNQTQTKNLEITLQESQFESGNSQYSISGNKAILSGSLGTLTYNQVIEINKNHPEVDVIELELIDGSDNDEINVQTGRLIRKAGYTTHVSSNSEIYSGGVDLFCSGKKRTMETGAKIGVHSWCCYEGKIASELPEDSEGHAEQIAYFSEMLGETLGTEFYFFTINVAPFDGIHLMTQEEIDKYGLITD